MIEWLATFVFLPSIFALWPKFSNLVDPSRAMFRSFTPKLLSQSMPRWGARLAVLAIVPASFVLSDVRLSFSVGDLFPSSHPLHRANETFKATRGWEAEVSLVFPKGKASESKIEALRNYSLIAKIEDMPGFLDDVAGEATGLDRELIEREVLNSSFADRLSSPQGPTRAIAYLRSTDVNDVVALQRFADDLCKDGSCYLTGDLIAYADFTRRVLTTLYESLFVSFGLVAAVLVFLAGWKRRRLIIPLIAASFWGPLLILIAIAVLHIQVDMVTVIVISTLVGLTGDNAILFLLSSRTDDLRDGIERRGQGSIQCNFLMAFSCLILLFSYFQPPRLLGVLLAAGLIASLFGDVWILKGLLRAKSEPKDG